MSIELLIVLGTLAVWRASHMIYDEVGPLGIFERIQAWAAKRQKRNGGLSDLLNCFYCVSTWFSFIPAYFLAYDIKSFILYTLAMSAGASIIQKIVEVLETTSSKNTKL